MFTPDTTSGYSQTEIDELNSEWLERVDLLDLDKERDEDEYDFEFKAFSDVVSRRHHEEPATYIIVVSPGIYYVTEGQFTRVRDRAFRFDSPEDAQEVIDIRAKMCGWDVVKK